jgi:hypothetical protein
VNCPRYIDDYGHDIAVFNIRKLSKIIMSELEVITSIAGVVGTGLKVSLILS